MFLDDEIYEIMTTTGDTDEVVKLIVDKFNEKVSTCRSNSEYVTIARQMCNLYESAIIRLKKVGITGLVSGGMRNTLLKHGQTDVLIAGGF